MAYMTHGLKIHPKYFESVITGDKTFEIRKNDRDYSVGDRLFLNEFDPANQQYTGRRTRVIVTYITNYAQVDNYVVMGIKIETAA
ncbi:ASCH/PUA domain-containing protein [Peribacillus frigoritolerans]|uniref:ASCH/PUA domain-containing protein n=1 Tax=Peribacillus frigoritolerans TaxID=450367 RepID=UPI003D08CEEF